MHEELMKGPALRSRRRTGAGRGQTGLLFDEFFHIVDDRETFGLGLDEESLFDVGG